MCRAVSFELRFTCLLFATALAVLLLAVIGVFINITGLFGVDVQVNACAYVCEHMGVGIVWMCVWVCAYVRAYL